MTTHTSEYLDQNQHTSICLLQDAKRRTEITSRYMLRVFLLTNIIIYRKSLRILVLSGVQLLLSSNVVINV